MKIAIIGAGAMGCRFGAMFHATGHEVILVDRWKEHVESIQNNGLRVISEKGETILPIAATVNPEDAGRADVVLIFTKASHTEAAVEGALPIIDERTLVMTLQNGLGNVEAMLKWVNKDQVIAGTTNFATELMGPGTIRALGSGQTHIMSVSGVVTPGLEQLEAAMNEAGMNVDISENAYNIIWNKVAFNAVMNPLTALTRLKVADLGTYGPREPFMREILKEIAQVANTQGVELDIEEILGTIRYVLDPEASGEHLSSMLQDILAKRPTEIEYMNGAIVRLAQEAGIPVPNNAMFYHLIRMLETTYERRVDEL